MGSEWREHAGRDTHLVSAEGSVEKCACVLARGCAARRRGTLSAWPGASKRTWEEPYRTGMREDGTLPIGYFARLLACPLAKQGRLC